MKTKIMIFLLLLSSSPMFAQWNTTGNNALPTDYLGTNNNQPLRIRTNSIERMNLTSGTGILGESNITKVNISYGGTQPTNAANVAMLNIGFTPPLGGQRSWMQVGTFACLNTDNMYIGMKNESGCISPSNNPPCDRADAVINWGDNNTTDPTFGPDNLRFIFTAPPWFSNLAGTENGAEMARISPLLGNTGFGNFSLSGSNIQPKRRCEIYDANPLTNANANLPQLRLTYTPNSNTNNGTWTDFQTTAAGDLYINPNNGLAFLAKERFVGIHKSNPGNTLEINAQWIGPPFAGDAGLRFTDLSPISPVQPPNSSNTVLSIDIDGDVILVQDQKGIGNCNAPTVLSANSGIQLSSNNFYFFGNNVTERVSVGGNCGDPLTAKFNIRGNAVIGSGYFGSATPPQNGLLVEGREGVGTKNPIRKLEVKDNAFQLRLSRTNSAGFADFLANPQGYLSINTSGNRVGIETNAIQSTLDVNGDANIRTVTQNDALTQILVRDPGNFGKIHWRDVSTLGSGGGVGTCNTLPTIIPTGDNGVIDLNGNNFYFEGATSTDDRVGIGIGCGGTLNGKLDVLQTSSGSISTGINVFNTGPGYGVYSLIPNAPISGDFIAGYFHANGSKLNYAVYGVADGLNGGGGSATVNFGGYFNAKNGITNYGVYGDVGAKLDYAGYFNGNVNVIGTVTATSDSILKENLSSISNPLGTIRQLQSYQFNFKTSDFPYLNLPDGNQFGLVAQEVENALPVLVKTIVHPAQFDSIGNEVSPELTFKGLNYTGLIPITLQAVKELDSIVTTLLPIPVPAHPTLVSPANGDTGLASPVMVVWNSAAYAASYLVVLSTDSAFSKSSIVDRYTTSDTALTLKTADNTTYYWFVTASNNSGTSASSETRNFSTQTVVVTSPEQQDSTLQAEMDSLKKAEYQKTLSDAQLKQNIQPLQNSIDKIKQLDEISFEWNQSVDASLDLPSGTIPGLMAQQTNAVIPEVVFTDDRGYKHVEYQRLIPYFVGAIKQQQATIENQQNAITVLQSAIANLQQNSPDFLSSQISNLTTQISSIQNCIDNLPPGMCEGGNARMANPNNNNSNIVQHDVVLKGEIVLDQNNPNPFKESTTIKYFIPEYINFAQIIFSDNAGRIINTVDIDHIGEGQLNVKAEKLSSGMYSYSIVVDGNVVDTKKMIKTK